LNLYFYCRFLRAKSKNKTAGQLPGGFGNVRGRLSAMAVRWFLLPFPLPCRLIFFGGISRSVFCFAPGVLDFALSLFHRAFGLGICISSPLSGLALYAPRYVFRLSLDAVAIHNSSSR
jgi:hypothetical protein